LGLNAHDAGGGRNRGGGQVGDQGIAPINANADINTIENAVSS
jgi:hypothetical protein